MASVLANTTALTSNNHLLRKNLVKEIEKIS